MSPTERYPCRCCGFWTLTDSDNASYEICPGCRWECDPIQSEDPLYEGGANGVSQFRASENYIRYGACKPEFLKNVRPPTPAEIPPRATVIGLEARQRSLAIRRVKAVLLGIVRAMQSRHIGIFDGCIAVAALAHHLDDPEIEDVVRTFAAVAGEIDDVPTAATRDLWAPEALTTKDAELANYESRVKDAVQSSCQELKEKLEAQLLR